MHSGLLYKKTQEPEAVPQQEMVSAALPVAHHFPRQGSRPSLGARGQPTKSPLKATVQAHQCTGILGALKH